MMATLPAYRPSPSPDASLLDSDSTISLSHWGSEAASVVQSSQYYNDIKLVLKFTPGLNSTTAITLLSSRRKGWLGGFLKVLYQDETVKELDCDHLLYTAKEIAEAIVTIIRRRPSSPAEPWDGSWIFSTLMVSTDISGVAKQFDTQIHSTFCKFTFEDWVAWCHGYQDEDILNFLDTVSNFRNDLIRLVLQNHALHEGLQSFQKALPSRQPLPCWIVSTALSLDSWSEPSEALGFLLDPIKRLLQDNSSGILRIARKLSILGTHFKLKVVDAPATRVNWQKPFRTDFSFWKRIQQSANYVAMANTKFVMELFLRLSYRDLFCRTENTEYIEMVWSGLVDDVLACLIIDGNLITYFMQFAEHLLLLWNVHSATAVGMALSKYGFRPRKPSPTWDIISPEDMFAGCRKFMAKNPCLPLISEYTVEIHLSGNGPDKITVVLQHGGCFGKQEVEAGQSIVIGEKVGGDDTVINRYPLCHAVQRLQDSINPRKHDDMTTRPDCSICKNAVNGVINTNIGRIYCKPLSPAEFHIAFRERYANEIWALTVQVNHQIFQKAFHRIGMMVSGTEDTPTITLEILSDLDRTQMALVSCAHRLTQPMSRHWTEEQKTAFACEFTRSVPGEWDSRDILHSWDKLLKDLIVHMVDKRNRMVIQYTSS